MQTLQYKETPKGTKILVKILPAMVNPLETKAQALKFAQALPEFKDLKDLFEQQKDAIKTYQRTMRLMGGNRIRQLAAAISEIQVELKEVAAQHALENPVYLKPVNSILVDDDHAAAIQADIKPDEFIGLMTDGDSFSHFVYDGKLVGTKYRLPGSLDWHLVQYPDERIPEEALFTEPTADEVDAVDVIRISGLTDKEKDNERSTLLTAAENSFVNESMRAEHLESMDTVAGKKAAKAVFDKAVKKIEAKYNA